MLSRGRGGRERLRPKARGGGRVARRSRSRRMRTQGGCRRRSCRARDTVGSLRLVASGPVRLEPGPASGQPAAGSIAISAALVGASMRPAWI